MSSADHTQSSTDEILQKFIDTSQRAGSAWGCWIKQDPSKLVNPHRHELVSEMQALGAELRRRKPLAKLRELFEHPDPDVRCWAGSQFLSVEPEWSMATLDALAHGLTTREVLDWRSRLLQKRTPPDFSQMKVRQLVDYFIDASERCYGATRFLSDEEGGGPTSEAYNATFDEFGASAQELKQRGELQALLPALDHPLITVRLQAATFCLPVVPEQAVPVLQAVAATKIDPEFAIASGVLDRWKNKRDTELTD